MSIFPNIVYVASNVPTLDEPDDMVFFGILGHGIQPIIYRKLKSMDPLVYQELILGIVVLKITFHRLDLSWYSMYRDNLNYDNA